MYYGSNEIEMQKEIDKLAKDEGIDLIAEQKKIDDINNTRAINALRSLVPGLEPLPVEEPVNFTLPEPTEASIQAGYDDADDILKGLETHGKIDSDAVKRMMQMLEEIKKREQRDGR